MSQVEITEADIDHIGNMCGSSEVCLTEETVKRILDAAIERGLVSPHTAVELLNEALDEVIFQLNHKAGPPIQASMKKQILRMAAASLKRRDKRNAN